MSSPDALTITAELITLGRSAAGGWTKAQLALLGVPWEPLKGWPARVIGKPISAQDREAFIAGRGRTMAAARKAARRPSNG